MQHYKFVNWRIGEFVFWCHEQVTSLHQICVCWCWCWDSKNVPSHYCFIIFLGCSWVVFYCILPAVRMCQAVSTMPYCRYFSLLKKHYFFFLLWLKLAISKGQLISKGLFAVFTCTKNERKHFCISALKYFRGFKEIFFFSEIWS